jgi:hypothetical protein
MLAYCCLLVFLSAVPTYISASTTSPKAIGSKKVHILVQRFVPLLSFPSSYALASLASCSPHRNFSCSCFISLYSPSYSTSLLRRHCLHALLLLTVGLFPLPLPASQRPLLLSPQFVVGFTSWLTNSPLAHS